MDISTMANRIIAANECGRQYVDSPKNEPVLEDSKVLIDRTLLNEYC